MNGDKESARRNVERARAVSGSNDARSVYADWAESYDRDVFATLKVTGTNIIADLLHEHAPDVGNNRVLDAGCGTGAVAARLKMLGITQIDGVDLSPEMLQVAREKKLYRNLVEADINHPLELPQSPYRAIVSAGTFVTGHVGAKGYHNLFAHLQSSGVMACVIANLVWQGDRFDKLLDELKVDVLVNRVEATIPDGEPDAHMLVVRKS